MTGRSSTSKWSVGCHAHGFAWACFGRQADSHAHAKPWAWHPFNLSGRTTEVRPERRCPSFQTVATRFGIARRFLSASLLVIAGFIASSDQAARVVRAQEPKVPTAQGPPNQDVLKFAGGGVYYVARNLIARRDRLIAQLQSLRSKVDEADITGDEALNRLATLKRDLESLQKRLDENKMLVTPFKMSIQTETVTFDLGSEKLVVITADDVRVESWAGPGVKCFLEKTVFTAGDESAEPQLKALEVVHQRGHFPQIVGRMSSEAEADERKFFDSPIGRKLNEAQRASRKSLVDEISGNYAIYRDFQGKEIDSIRIKGTEYDQNRSILFRTTSDDGTGTLGSTRQRHVKLTVFLPACKSVALRGCLVGLHVQGLKTALAVTNADSRDRDYDGRFEIANHVGPVRVEHVPIQKIDHVQGDVRLLLTEEFSNTGTTNQGNWRLMFAPAPNELDCTNIIGGLSAWCGRMNLKLAGISGPIDVRNEFGDTVLTVDPSTTIAAHRVVSEAGRIDAIVPLGLVDRLPLFAATSHGKVETNADDKVLAERLFGTSGRKPGDFRNWRAFASKSLAGSQFENFGRVALALAGESRPPGLDLISRDGTVAVKVAK